MGSNQPRETLYPFEEFLDRVNVVSKVPLVGRDLTDKMSGSLLPFIGGSASNVGWSWVNDHAENIEDLRQQQTSQRILEAQMDAYDLQPWTNVPFAGTKPSAPLHWRNKPLIQLGAQLLNVVAK